MTLTVSVGVHLCKGLERFVVTPFVDVPSRALRYHPDESQLKERGNGLHHRRDAPRPIVGDFVGTERQPCGDDGSEVPGRIVDCGKDRTILGMDEFGDQKWAGMSARKFGGLIRYSYLEP